MLVSRFPPSPTGVLHLGGARTALFAWLLAKRHHGRFVLRIEDTDKARSTEASVQAILQGLTWLGINWDVGPTFQSERLTRYQTVLGSLLENDQAYYCNCSKERLDAVREAQMQKGEKPRYDGYCRDLILSKDSENPDQVVRFKTPQAGQQSWVDGVRGEIMVQNSELDDLIVCRGDGLPTYNFAAVVDDHDGGITDVVRGDDHINNTPRQMHVYQALGWEVPNFAHLPMILGDDGQRLSKRHGAVDVMSYRQLGYLPQAMLNYLVRLGWSHGDQEIFSVNEMIEYFDLKHISHSPAHFSLDKLNWINQQSIQHASLSELLPELEWHFEQAGIDVSQGPDVADVLTLMRDRAKTLVELVEQSRFWYERPKEFDANAAKKHLRPAATEPMVQLRSGLEALETWTADGIDALIAAICEKMELKMPKVAMPLRVAIAGCGQSPAVGATAALLAKEEVLARLDLAMKFIQERAEQNA